MVLKPLFFLAYFIVVVFLAFSSVVFQSSLVNPSIRLAKSLVPYGVMSPYTVRYT